MLEPAVKFLQWLVTKQMVPEEEKPKVAAALHKIKAAMAAQAAGGEKKVEAAAPAENETLVENAAPAAASSDAAAPAADQSKGG